MNAGVDAGIAGGIIAPAVCMPISVYAMGDSDAAVIAVLLKAVADPLRLRMLSAIAADPRGESCVCDLVELTHVTQPTVSHHLRVLKDAGLLDSERRGTWVWYRVTAERRPAVDALLETFVPAVLAHTELRSAAQSIAHPAAHPTAAHPTAAPRKVLS